MNSREIAYRVLYKLDKDKAYVNNVLSDSLKSSEITELDKGFITEIVMGCIKNRTLIDFYIMQFSKIKIRKMSIQVRNILEMGVYQMMFMSKVPDSAICNESVKIARKYVSKSSGFVNGILRNVARNKETIKNPEKTGNIIEYLSVYYSYPEWITQELVNQYGYDECEEIFKCANKPHSPSIRANRLKVSSLNNNSIDAKLFIETLNNDGITVKQDDELEYCFNVSQKLDIKKSVTYKDGLFTIQNRSSQMTAVILGPKPDEFIIDVCAAPGGKTTGIAEIMGNKGRIVAFDIHEHKISLIENTAKRLGIDIIEAYQNDATIVNKEYINSADRVLVDAPCSGLGVIHTKPDIKWHREQNDVLELTKIQKSILESAAQYVKSGGYLVYSTCTILKQENENQIIDFLKTHQDFELILERKLLTHIDGGSGFYIAKLKRS